MVDEYKGEQVYKHTRGTYYTQAAAVGNSYDIFFFLSTIHIIISEPAFAAVIVNKR